MALYYDRLNGDEIRIDSNKIDKEGKRMFFPVFLDVKNKKILVIGGGKLAYRKSETLKRYGAEITVCSAEIREERLLNLEGIKIADRNVEKSNIEIGNTVQGYFMVIAATDDTELNDMIASVCMEKGILVNNVSSKTEMNTMFGAVISDREFQVAVSTGGKSCRRARALKEEIRKIMENLESGTKGEQCTGDTGN